MLPLISENIDQIIALCKSHHVVRLEIFGSVLRDDFDPQKSDLDFLVELEDLPPVEYAESFFGLEDELNRLFKRKVDLVETDQIKNPYVLKSINRSRTTLYAA